MSVRLTTIVLVGVIMFSVALSAWLYPQMPEQVVGHWNAAGEPDGTMSRFWGLFLLPFIIAISAALFFVLPVLDPLRRNIELFRPTYNAFITGFAIFMFYVHGLTLLWNTGTRFDMGRAFLPAFGLGLFLLGMMLRRTKRNWFIGIRTPWTMSSDAVWSKTHALGATLFEAAGMVALLGALGSGRYFLWFLMIPLLASLLVVIVASYVFYRQEQRLSSGSE